VDRGHLKSLIWAQQDSFLTPRLAISPRTAELHRAHVMRKLGLQTLTALIRYALRHSLIPLEA
jgi:FixJ family two-component response regulator